MSDPQPIILQRMRQRPLLFDGAMGSMIYEHGVFVNACYDDLCRSRQDLILQIHQAYVDAGVDVIETNSFGANRLKLAGFGLAEETSAINRAAADLARRAAGDRVLVAGAVGPLLPPGTASDAISDGETDALFHEQIDALRAGGVDAILLESFDDPLHLMRAAAVARASGLAVIASFTVRRRELVDAEGRRIEVHFAEALSLNPDVDIIGINCGVGPAGMLELLRNMMPSASKPVLAMPNAGGPAEVGGRMMYFNSPEYFTEYARRFIEVGARAVGGCCGTRPEDVRCAVRAIAGMSGVREHVRIRTSDERETMVSPPVPMSEKSRLGARLAAGERVSAVEMLPPRRTDGLEAFVAAARRAATAGVDAINLPDGPRASARISVLVAAMTLQRDAGIETIPHYCCRDRNLIGMQSDLMGGIAAGLHNWLLITGDPPKLGDYPDASGVFDLDAIGLCRLCSNLNRGLDAVGKAIGPPAGMLLGVGANPAAVEINREVDHLAAKIDAGADFAITQPVFDEDALLRFLDRIERFPKSIPVLAGIYPLISLQNAVFMSRHVPGVVIPPSVLERMARCRTREDGIAVGTDIARGLRDAVADRVAGLQVSAPLGKLQIALDVLAD